MTGTVQYEKEEYVNKMKAGQRDIYYLCAPSRQLAETSPYFESLKKSETYVFDKLGSRSKVLFQCLGQSQYQSLSQSLTWTLELVTIIAMPPTR